MNEDKEPKSTWRYVLSRVKDGDDYLYGIREYYEFSDGTTSWTAEFIAPVGDTATEMMGEFVRMADAALSGEILDLSLDPPALVPCPVKKEHEVD